MIRNFFIFFGTFVIGAIAALVIRAANHDAHEAAAAPVPSAEYAPMVANALTPAASEHSHSPGSATTPPTSHGDHGSGHSQPRSAASENGSNQPVNTICAICGMDVDPSLPTEEYQGKRIGFGCRMCPPKFKSDPDKYGPFYLRNERIKR